VSNKNTPKGDKDIGQGLAEAVLQAEKLEGSGENQEDSDK
jgi:hypothetical protein